MSAKYREIRFLNIIQIPRVRSHSVRSFCPVYKEYTYFYQYLMVLILSLSGVHYHGRGGEGGTFLVLGKVVWLMLYSPKEFNNYKLYKIQKIKVSIIIPSSRVKSYTYS